MSFDDPEAADDRTWPTKEDPANYYKFSSFWIERGSETTTIERETYSALEWIGDIGGLYDGFLIMGNTVAGPLAAITLKAKLIAWLFARDEKSAPGDTSVGVGYSSRKKKFEEN